MGHLLGWLTGHHRWAVVAGTVGAGVCLLDVAVVVVLWLRPAHRGRPRPLWWAEWSRVRHGPPDPSPTDRRADVSTDDRGDGPPATTDERSAAGTAAARVGRR